MTATVQPYNSPTGHGFTIVCRDNSGQVVERIAVTDVFVEGDPHPQFTLEPSNRMRLAR